MNGWIRLHRQITENYLWRELPFDRKSAWIDLLLIASHRDGHIRVRGIKVEVKRGQVGYSVLTLAARWGWSRGKVTRFLMELQNEQQIKQQSNNITSLITIVNFELYQSDDTTNRASNEATDRTANGHYKEGKEVKNKYLSDFFEKLWKAYPKKDGRKSAERHFNATVKNEYDMERINLALGHYLDHIEANKFDLKYIKNGSTWFSNWQDWEVIDGK
jgi:hypothetical protein